MTRANSNLPNDIEEAVRIVQQRVTDLNTESIELVEKNKEEKASFDKEVLERSEWINKLQAEYNNLDSGIKLKKEEIVTVNSQLAEAGFVLNEVNNDITKAEGRRNDVNTEIETRLKEVADKEARSNERESALNVYATALGEKEKKINKYLGIFDNMKDIITRD